MSVVLLAAPSINDEYYVPFFDDIIALFARFVKASHPNDRLLIVSDDATLPSLEKHIPRENLINGSIFDIWIRDFAPIRTQAGNFAFIYQPAYLDKDKAYDFQQSFHDWLSAMQIEVEHVSLVLDGGNFNYNGSDCAVMTDRVLEDNPGFEKQEIITLLKNRLGLEYLSIIPQVPGDVLGHSDGMVIWLSERQLGISQLEEPVRSAVFAALEKEFKEVQLVELPYEISDRTWLGAEDIVGFGDFGGVYANALRTDNAIYVPTFGVQADEVAFEVYCSQATKKIIPVKMGDETRLGGGLRCLSWSLNGTDAEKILRNGLRE